MLKILIIYELVPEETKLYIVDVTADEWAWIQKTHTYFVNMIFEDHEREHEDACHQLTEWLDKHKPLNMGRGEAAPVVHGLNAVVHTGFLL